VRFFSIPTIKESIARLEHIKGNWLLPAFVFAANDVGTELVDLAKRRGTDSFLDHYFNGDLLGLPTFHNGSNLLRPRFSDVTGWRAGQRYAGDYVVRQGTKMWGNLFSSRGYREMRQRGFLAGEKTIVALTNTFQAQFEQEVPPTFYFEDLMVWLFAFQGFPDEIQSWSALMDYLLQKDLELKDFRPQYKGRFKLADPPRPWPELLTDRPSNDQLLQELAPALRSHLKDPEFTLEGDAEAPRKLSEDAPASLVQLDRDDAVLSAVTTAIQSGESFAFLLAGPPGTGKTRYARQLAAALTDGEKGRSLFLQFHPALGYEDFMEGFRPAQSEKGEGIRYALEPRLFLKFANEAAEHPGDKYVVVIDELNRGDVARIFGEALTYLEADYRGQKFTLPFSGSEASLPPNLIMIATANPYDRSVTDLDDALLRRFWVVELEPDRALLQKHLEAQGVAPPLVTRTLHLFELLNNAFPTGFGHTTFLRVRAVEDLSAIWTSRIRLALKRSLLHDKTLYDTTAADIEALLSVPDAE
jgi:MoxR-like ATPase